MNIGPKVRSRHISLKFYRALLCLMMLSAMISVRAQEDPAQRASRDAMDGRFLIVHTETALTDDVLLLNAEIVYNLSPGAREALNNGVALTFETQIELDRVRRFLPDPTLVTLVQRFELNYHALTQRFVVRNINSSEQTSHADLSSALYEIGQLRALPVIDVSLLDQNAVYTMRMRSVLDTRSYAAPLRMLAALFRVDDWRLESPWERWLVTL